MSGVANDPGRVLQADSPEYSADAVNELCCLVLTLAAQICKAGDRGQ